MPKKSVEYNIISIKRLNGNCGEENYKMTFKTQIMGGQLCVRVKTAPYEKMDGNELNRFSQLSLEGFLRPKAYPNYLIDYVGPMGVSLYEILKRPISKKDYLYILEQIVAAVQRIQVNGLNVGYVVMFPYQIYVNYLTKEVNFIYFPSNNFQNFNLVQLFEFVVSTVKMVDPKDRVFALDFAKFIKDLKPFDTNKIEALIAREDSEVVAMVKKTPINNVVNVPNAVQQPSEKNEEGKISTNADMEDIVPEPKVEMVEIEAEIMEVQDIKKPEIDEVVEEIIDEPVEEFAAEIVLDEVNELEDEIFEIVDDTGILDCVENDVVDIIEEEATEEEAK